MAPDLWLARAQYHGVLPLLDDFLEPGPEAWRQQMALLARQAVAADLLREVELPSRRQQYGLPAEHFEQVARRWSLTRGMPVQPEAVLLCQLDLKLVRLAQSGSRPVYQVLRPSR